MRRIVIAVMGTISTLVMLFAFDASHRSDGGVATALGADGSGADGSGSIGNGSIGNGPDGGGPTGTTDDNGTLGSGDDGASGEGTGDDGQSAGPSPSPTRAAATTKAAAGSKTYTGDSVMTHWGPVQVQITVKSGKVVKSRAVVYPNANGHDIRINNFALPILDKAAVSTQSANLDNISGATVTTDGYKQSLQTALDRAHL